MKRTKGKEGFTLIELMIVIAVIGILAAVLIPYTFRAQDRARETGVQNAARAIQTGLEMYASNRVRAPWYPEAALDITNDTTGLASMVSPVPKNPFTGAGYLQTISPNTGTALVFILGATATGGTENPGAIEYQTNGSSYTLILYGAQSTNKLNTIVGGH